jgi:hypothetical protein
VSNKSISTLCTALETLSAQRSTLDRRLRDLLVGGDGQAAVSQIIWDELEEVSNKQTLLLATLSLESAHSTAELLLKAKVLGQILDEVIISKFEITRRLSISVIDDIVTLMT